MSFLRTESLTIKRKAAGSYVNGHFVAGDESTISIDADVRPLTGIQILQLPEADRKRESYNLYTESEIKVNDIVVRDSKEYEIQKVLGYPYEPIPHYEGVMLLVEG